MKKRLYAVLVILALAVLLNSCGLILVEDMEVIQIGIASQTED